MVSFEIKFLLTFTPVTETIDSKPDSVYNRKEISTVLKKHEMTKLLTLCTKTVYFTLKNETVETRLKIKQPKKHKHDLIYSAKCSETSFTE